MPWEFDVEVFIFVMQRKSFWSHIRKWKNNKRGTIFPIRLLLLFIFFLACRLCEAKHDKWWDKTHLVHFCVMCVPWVIYCMSVRLGSVVIVNDPEVSAGDMQKSVFQTLASGSMFPLQYKLKVFLQCFRSACHVDLLIFIYLLIYLLHFSLYHFLSCLPFPCMSLNHLVCISLAV